MTTKIKFVCDNGEEINGGELLLKNSIRLAIAGYLYDGGDIIVIPSLLHEMYEDYRDEIKKQIHEQA